jgi:hypothetical protein
MRAQKNDVHVLAGIVISSISQSPEEKQLFDRSERERERENDCFFVFSDESHNDVSISVGRICSSLASLFQFGSWYDSMIGR